MKLKKLYFLFIIIPLLAFTTHKYYLSLTQIKFKEESKAVQIIINVFMDDIEIALNKDYDIDLQLATKKELKNNDVYFKRYLKKKLQFKINTSKKEFTYIGKEYDGDLVYFYLEIEDITEVNSIEITNKILFIFDEPTTGLHFNDIKKLLHSFYSLIDKGHSIICIEHNLDVIKCADWIIDLGPEGGDKGGKVLFNGIPENIIKEKKSYTGQFLKKKINY